MRSDRSLLSTHMSTRVKFQHLYDKKRGPMGWVQLIPQNVRDQLRIISKTQLAQDVLINVSPSIVLLYVAVRKTETYFANTSSLLISILSYLGAFVILYSLLVALHSFYARNIRRPKKNLSSYSGKWAIVTGATSAIGSAFCRKLAAYGMNVILIGRNKDKLQHLSHLLNEETTGRIKTRILVHDFSNDTTLEFQNVLKNKLEKYSHHHGIGMLIHCANFRNEIPTLLHEMEDADVQRLVEANIDSTIQLVQTVLPFLIHQRFGAIVTVSSHACNHPAPLVSLYTATNAYRSDMMKTLFRECKHYNLDCISVTPELMSSNIPRTAPSSSIIKSPNAERVVNNTLCMLGYEEEAFPFRGHAQSTWIPEWIWVNPWDRFLYKMKNARAEILRKHVFDYD